MLNIVSNFSIQDVGHNSSRERNIKLILYDSHVVFGDLRIFLFLIGFL
jgi:hypothetical protein